MIDKCYLNHFGVCHIRKHCIEKYATILSVVRRHNASFILIYFGNHSSYDNKIILKDIIKHRPPLKLILKHWRLLGQNNVNISLCVLWVNMRIAVSNHSYHFLACLSLVNWYLRVCHVKSSWNVYFYDFNHFLIPYL